MLTEARLKTACFPPSAIPDRQATVALRCRDAQKNITGRDAAHLAQGGRHIVRRQAFQHANG
ncbi:MAG: hypothetical protein LBU76_05095 [Azoarcus sp.]|nr:hypothetical protein [Azoarcus sp.]